MDGCEFMNENLSVVVIGASGDLAKKKTFPSLFALYASGLLPKHVTICGYARSAKTDEEHREMLRTALKGKGEGEKVEEFLGLNIYSHGKSYEDKEGFQAAIGRLEKNEAEMDRPANRLFYFAIPPTVFIDSASTIKEVGMSTTGWTRVIVEKPFGRDLDSFETMSKDLRAIFDEDTIFRIDHFLGKEMTQNLSVLRFANSIFEPIWNNRHIASIMITFKENFGTQGRGGYFDEYGIIRDVMQNHLLQVLALFAMEPPSQFAGERTEVTEYIRDEKCKLLRCMEEINSEEVILGQYEGIEGEPGYTEDPTVPDDSRTPTFAVLVMKVRTPRWDGVPFIMRAGKALNEKKTEVRVQFKQPAASSFMFGSEIPQNELVCRLQPGEAIYMKTNIKQPGISSDIVTTELDLSYTTRFEDEYKKVPDAYTRLILDTLRGDKSSFVRDDELRESWKIFSPLLKQIDQGKLELHKYKFGTRGPELADELIKRNGFVYKGTYHWNSKK